MRALRSIAIYYEHPDWFRPLFAELDRRSLRYLALDASGHGFDPSRLDGLEDTLVFNRMSPSAWKRGRGHVIPYTHQWLRYLDETAVPVVNGVDAFTVETSKALQLSILRGLGLDAPRTRVVNHPTALPVVAAELEFPILVKPNIGGSGAGIARFDTPGQLEAAVEQDAILPSLDDILLAQEYHPPRDGHIVRVETLEGGILYAVRVHLGAGAGFNLCPAEICRDASGASLASAACPAEPLSGLTVEAFDPPEDVCAEVAAIARAARLDVGGVEYLVSARDGRRVYYDVNALSNFVADPVRVLGFDPWIDLVDMLVKRAAAVPRARGMSLVPRATAPPISNQAAVAPPPARAVAFSEEMGSASIRSLDAILTPRAMEPGFGA
jgi:hypothetical protein